MTTPSDDEDWDDETESTDADAADLEPSDLPLEDEADGPTTALLPDGSTLALTGPGAGRASGGAAESALQPIPLGRRDECLEAGPLVLYHRPREGAGDIPRLMASVVAATRGRVAIGAVSPLPSLTAASNQAWLTGCVAAGVRIADPMCFKLDADMGQRPFSSVTSRHWQRLQADPSVIADVLDAQRAVGANLLLTSGRMLAVGDPQQSLDDACAEGDEALALLARGERLALNLTLPTEWLTNGTLRGLLLDQLLDQEQFDVWYVRVLWPATPAYPQQPTGALLDGYKRLAQLADDEERRLLLPQTGLTGWLQLAFGATGFGTSPTGSGQGLRRVQGGGGGFPPVERYFEPSLLHVVERATHDALARTAGYVRCMCPYCPALFGGADWSHPLARLHHAYWCGRLSDPGSRPAGAIRRTVRAAVREAGLRAPVLTGPNAPTHLQAWDRLL